MPFYVSDYLGAVLTMTLEQRGAYVQILAVTWERGADPLPDDDVTLARVCSVTARRWREVLRPALAPLFDISAGFWRQNRLEIEWTRAQGLIEKRAAAGSMGGKAKSAKTLERGLANATAKAVANADPVLQQRHYDCSSIQIQNQISTSNEVEIAPVALEPAKGKKKGKAAQVELPPCLGLSSAAKACYRPACARIEGS